MFRSIVVMVDPAAEASGCVREAGELAERTGARLTLLAVAPCVRGFSPVFWAATVAPPNSPAALQEACECECESLLRRALESVPEGVPVTMTVRRGRAHARLLEEVRDADHDLVVLDGSRSRGLRRAAELRFMRRCRVPVLRVGTSPGPSDADAAGKRAPGTLLAGRLRSI
jgi:hypothetical protein